MHATQSDSDAEFTRPNDIDPPFRPGPVEGNDDKVPTSDSFRPRPPQGSIDERRPQREPSNETLRGRRLVQLRAAYQRG